MPCFAAQRADLCLGNAAPVVEEGRALQHCSKADWVHLAAVWPVLGHAKYRQGIKEPVLSIYALLCCAKS